jgi:BlaI family penicillinase repressor
VTSLAYIQGDEIPMAKLPDLSTAEWTIMKTVWKLEKTTVREVYEELLEETNWAYNTVRTMMERLCEKGYLNVRMVGRTNFYRPEVTRRKVTQQALRGFIERIYDGAVGPVICHLIENENLPPEELEEIRSLLEEEKK